MITIPNVASHRTGKKKRAGRKKKGSQQAKPCSWCGHRAWRWGTGRAFTLLFSKHAHRQSHLAFLFSTWGQVASFLLQPWVAASFLFHFLACAFIGNLFPFSVICYSLRNALVRLLKLTESKKDNENSKGKKALRKRWKKRRVFNDDNVVKRAKTLFSSFLKQYIAKKRYNGKDKRKKKRIWRAR